MSLPQPVPAARRRAKGSWSRVLLTALVSATVLLLVHSPDKLTAAVVAEGGDEEKAPESTFWPKVIGAAAQGCTAAFVAAWLSAFSEPVVNRLLVNRMTVGEAISSVKVADCLKFFLTTFPTNMLKFPMFEVINISLSFTSLSGGLRGVVNGALFCSLMLPVTNYRFRKSMNLPINPALLYQAYPPTVLRDILYGWSRGVCGGLLSSIFPNMTSTFTGRCLNFGLTIFLACIVSSPCNEWRGYWLQPPDRKLPFGQFFKPERYARSTGVGATIMGIALSVGMYITPWAEQLFAVAKGNPLPFGIVGVVGAGVLAKVLSGGGDSNKK